MEEMSSTVLQMKKSHNGCRVSSQDPNHLTLACLRRTPTTWSPSCPRSSPITSLIVWFRVRRVLPVISFNSPHSASGLHNRRASSAFDLWCGSLRHRYFRTTGEALAGVSRMTICLAKRLLFMRGTNWQDSFLIG